MDKSHLSLSIAGEHYLATCRTEGKTAATLRGYHEKLSRFVRWFSGVIGEFTIEVVRDYVAHLQAAAKYDGHPHTPANGQGLAALSVRHHVAVLKGFATWLYEESYTQENVLQRLALPNAPRKVVEPLSPEEIATLLSSIDQNAANGCRDLAIVVLLLDTGLRLGELLSIRLDDLHLEDQWLKVLGKGQKERIVPFGAQATRVLGRYLTFFRPSAYGYREFFLTVEGAPLTQTTVSLMFARLRKRSGIRRLHPHLLRHTFALSYLLAGGDAFSLQAILGHTTLEMTRRYVALASAHVQVQHHRFSPMDRVQVPGLRVARKGGLAASRPVMNAIGEPARLRSPAFGVGMQQARAKRSVRQ